MMKYIGNSNSKNILLTIVVMSLFSCVDVDRNEKSLKFEKVCYYKKKCYPSYGVKGSSDDFNDTLYIYHASIIRDSINGKRRVNSYEYARGYHNPPYYVSYSNFRINPWGLSRFYLDTVSSPYLRIDVHDTIRWEVKIDDEYDYSLFTSEYQYINRDTVWLEWMKKKIPVYKFLVVTEGLEPLYQYFDDDFVLVRETWSNPDSTDFYICELIDSLGVPKDFRMIMDSIQNSILQKRKIAR